MRAGKLSPGRAGTEVRLIVDLIRAFPEGAPTRAILEQLIRAGIAMQDAANALLALERAGRVALQGERWRLTST